MATYNKRGYKPKNKKEAEEEQSTTAGVFKNLDSGASKTEDWVTRNQKPIFTIIGIVVIAILAYLGYNKFILQPQQEEAVNEMSRSQVYFSEALDSEPGAEQDSLYHMAINGGGGYGFLDIADNYSGTDAANLAHYYAGMAYLKLREYKKAVNQLEKFSSDDEILAPLAKGAIGDSFLQNKQPEQALDYYEEAAKMRDNAFTTPRFLLKAATTALDLGQPDKAIKYLDRIADEYPDSAEADKVSVYRGQAEDKN